MAADLPSCEVDLARDHSVLLVSWEPTGAMAWCPPISTWLWQLPRADAPPAPRRVPAAVARLRPPLQPHRASGAKKPAILWGLLGPSGSARSVKAKRD